MSHLGEKTAEFVLGELSRTEMDEAKQHVAACGECRNGVEDFQRTHSMLKASPDSEAPRRIIFEAEKRAPAWRWLMPAGVAAAVILAVILASPLHVQWHDSQLTIAFGQVPASVTPAPVVVKESVIQPVDYERIIAAVRQSEHAWLANEFRIRDAAHGREIQQIGAQIAWIEDKQHTAWKETLDNASAIQVLAKNGFEE